MPLKVIATRSAKPEAKPLVIGVEFNQTQITVALVDEQARLIAERQFATPQKTTRATVAAIAQTILELASSKERGLNPIAAIGISIAGLVDPPTGRISISEMKGWTRVPLAQLLEESLNESGHDIRTPIAENRSRAGHTVSAHPVITISQNAAAVAAAESWHGAAQGKNNVVYLSIGSEIEAGILADGRALAGTTGLAGAAGWLAVGQEFKHEYEANGCLSAEATFASLVRRAIEESSGYDGSMLGALVQTGVEFDAATVIRAARGDDKLAVKVIGDTCRWLGRGVANMISILNPDAVVIGGELGVALKSFFDEIREEARRWAAPEAARQCRILAASVGEKAGVIGAARLAWLKAGQ
ncbi:MAG: ROK family protein [Blastocatellia bacterium]